MCCNDMRTYRVRVTVAGGSPVLQVSVALLRHVPGDPDAAAPVGHPGTEVVDAGGLVQTSQPPLVVLRKNWKTFQFKVALTLPSFGS